jgi:hypothetical protein
LLTGTETAAGMKRLQNVLFRKRVLFPLAAVVVMAGACWGINYRVMKGEAVLYEVGQGIRGRLDDFSADYKKGESGVIASYFADAFAGSDLGFERRAKISEEGGIVLEEWKASPGPMVDRAEMCAQLMAYRGQLHEAEKTAFKMVFLNEYGENRANILMRFQVYAHDREGHPIEDRGHFNVDLVRRQGDWRIVKQQLLNARRALGVDSRYFVDVTAQAGIDFNTGVNEIFKQRHYPFAVADRPAGGVTSGDYNNDGYPDLFLAGSEGSKLYRNTGHGTFEDVTAAAGLDGEKTSHAQGCVFADYNNDGYLDLFVTKTAGVSNRLFKNNGDGTFTDVTKEAGVGLASYSYTAGFADIDNDGDLDLFVCVSGNAAVRAPDPPSHDRDGEPDRLYRNNGDGTFTDITKEAGVGDTGWGIGMTFLDYDNDGDQDIYIANDFGPNSLYQNDGTGHFKQVAPQAGAVDYGFGMSASCGDYDNDGDLDIYVSNVYSGSTWYIQHTVFHFAWVRYLDPTRTFRTLRQTWEAYQNFGSLRKVLGIGRKFGEGNSLLENQADGTFKSVGVEKGVNMAGWAWGSNFFDFDNDGDLDIHAVNGWISQKRGTDL